MQCRRSWRWQCARWRRRRSRRGGRRCHRRAAAGVHGGAAAGQGPSHPGGLLCLGATLFALLLLACTCSCGSRLATAHSPLSTPPPLPPFLPAQALSTQLTEAEDRGAATERDLALARGGWAGGAGKREAGAERGGGRCRRVGENKRELPCPAVIHPPPPHHPTTPPPHHPTPHPPTHTPTPPPPPPAGCVNAPRSYRRRSPSSSPSIS